MDKGIRTLGDGMENTPIQGPLTERLNDLGGLKLDKTKVDLILKGLKPIEGKKLYKLIPKYTPLEQKGSKYLFKKPKDPRFVPYEPYKAAVMPIVTSEVPKKKDQKVEQKLSKNNIAIQQLAHQLSEMRKAEMEKLDVITEPEGALKLRLQWDRERENYETDIRNLRETNTHLENQLKFQAQVNSELKTLLVAAVGEDLETRVQHLTEDKLSLARALLNSANHLTSHQEHTEWLSGQCEVWKSKFLASSVMVEELAKWKSALTNRINELQEVLKVLLDERSKVNSNCVRTYVNLKAVSKQLAADKCDNATLKYGNVLEIANLSRDLSCIILDALEISVEDCQTIVDKIMPTVAERKAEKLLQNPVTVTNKQDILCSAVMGAATSLERDQLNQDICIHNCCAHCKGDIQNI
ncbi:unnamed protein product [Callosobruchus maculatus]|uniref:Golgin-45 n=1 Tax=Callosobruchus maculatus TaxID=64391 RepID=A0A653C874_CALMS|nr:unnamed protein product [Callosobruchus maculatus]